MFGISVYSLKDYSLAGNIAYIEQAAALGYKYLFTSLHIPEVDYRSKIDELQQMLAAARNCDFHVIADVGPLTFELFRATAEDLSAFAGFGVKTLRLDYGFSIEQTVTISRNSQSIALELNASTLSEKRIQTLLAAGVPVERLRACHNFYPKPCTGLTASDYERKTRMISGYGLPCSTFIPSATGKRGPLYEGVPTIEAHRNMNAVSAAKYFLYDGNADRILFGDAYAATTELTKVAALNPELVEIEFTACKELCASERVIVARDFYTSRADSPEYVIRASESRMLGKISTDVEVGNSAVARTIGAITIDNQEFGRYSGELNICLGELPPDKRVNVVGYVCDDDLPLLKLIRPGNRFRLVLEN